MLDDATSEIYYARLVQEESTRTVMDALRSVIESNGLFCSLYSDRGSHFFVTRKGGEKVDPHRLTQVGRALKEAANVFLAEEYFAEYYRRFAVAAAEKGGAFLRCPRKDLDWVFSIQHERA